MTYVPRPGTRSIRPSSDRICSARLGALVNIHEKLSEAGVNVYASTGVADGRGGFGYVMYIKEDQFKDAMRILDL